MGEQVGKKNQRQVCNSWKVKARSRNRNMWRTILMRFGIHSLSLRGFCGRNFICKLGLKNKIFRLSKSTNRMYKPASPSLYWRKSIRHEVRRISLLEKSYQSFSTLDQKFFHKGTNSQTRRAPWLQIINCPRPNC